MPNYPSNFIGGAAPGSQTQDNIAAGRELKDLAAAAIGQGPYPTDQHVSTAYGISPVTETLHDLVTELTNLIISINGGTNGGFSSVTGTVSNSDSSATTTVFKTSLTSSTTNDPTIVGSYVVFTSGALAGHGANITAYNATTKAITVGVAFGSIPANAVTFSIVSVGPTGNLLYKYANVMDSNDKAYIANLMTIQINHLQDAARRLNVDLIKFNVDCNAIAGNYTPVVSMYPSGQNRGF